MTICYFFATPDLADFCRVFKKRHQLRHIPYIFAKMREVDQPAKRYSPSKHVS